MKETSFIHQGQREIWVTYFEEIFFVVNSGEDQQDQKEKRRTDDGQINRFVLQKIGIGKNITPIDWFRKNNKTTGERGQMFGKTLGLLFVGQSTHLERR